MIFLGLYLTVRLVYQPSLGLLLGAVFVGLRWWMSCVNGRALVLLAIVCVALCNLWWKDSQRLVLEEGAVSGYLEIYPEDVRFRSEDVFGQGLLHLEGKKVPVSFYSKQTAFHSELAGVYGIEGNLSKPQEARNFGVFDYRSFLEGQGIDYQLSVEDILDIRPNSSWRGYLSSYRQRLLQVFKEVSDNDWVALHNKVLFNIDSEKYREYQETFSSLGIIHLFAISGFHVHYIHRLFRWLLLRLGITIESTHQAWSFFLFFYAWLVAWPVGVVRVLAIHGLTCGQKIFDWPLSSLDRLALSGILILLVDPYQSVSLGFLFSYLMTYLIRFYLQDRAESVPVWQQGMEISLFCLVFSWPFTLNMTFEWHWAQWVSVVVLGAVFEKLLIPLFFLTTAGLVIRGDWVFIILEKMNDVFLYLWRDWEIDAWIQTFRVVVGHLSPGMFFVLVVLNLVWFHCFLYRPKRSLQILVLGYCFFLLGIPWLFPKERITVLDVGQGDSLLYQSKRQNWLIDTGGRLDFEKLKNGGEELPVDLDHARKHYLPALKALGVNRLDGVIITHPDLDHMGNLALVDKHFPIKEILLTPFAAEDDLIRGSDLRAPLRVLDYGHWVETSRIPMILITPEDSHLLRGDDASNDSSIGTLINLKSYQFLNLGDLSADGERLFREKYPDLQVDIFNLSHHGSQTSSPKDFLNGLGPQLATISCGYKNRYGHPHPEVLANLKESKIPHVSTADVGAIQFWVDRWGELCISTAKKSFK